MYEVLFYTDKNGNSEIIDYLDHLKKESATSKTARINCITAPLHEKSQKMPTRELEKAKKEFKGFFNPERPLMKKINTFAEYMADEERVTSEEREKIEFEADLIKKMVEAREAKGLSQRQLAELSGVKQPAIARIESLKSTPQIDTLFKLLAPLGYTLQICEKK